MRGTVKWFSSPKGYGFITDEQGNDVFVHFSNLKMEGWKTIEAGTEVEFDIEEKESEDGQGVKVYAVNVVRV